MIWPGAGGQLRAAQIGVAVAGCLLVALGLDASEARPAKSDQVTITMLANSLDQPAWQVLIPNFERVYPDITVEPTYAPSAILNQLETTELGAGGGPDILSTQPGCGTVVSICVLAKDGDLAPMIKVGWAKRSLPVVTSLSKYGEGLFAFEPGVSLMGAFTNDALFSRLGLKVPQTFSQLLAVCEQAKADGTVGVLLPGADQITTKQLIVDLAVATLYGKSKGWPAELKAGTVSFDGTAGWHQALQEFVDMNTAGCFEPGVTGSASVIAQFAAGQGLMLPGLSTNKGLIDAADPGFRYSFHPFPGASEPEQTQTFVNLSATLSVNTHSSAQNQAAAQTFVNFVARPAQDALYTQIRGGLTQYQFLKDQLPSFMPAIAPVLRSDEYVINPSASWWNASIQLTLQQDQIGLLTGQTSIDETLNAMDAAWKQGPS